VEKGKKGKRIYFSAELKGRSQSYIHWEGGGAISSINYSKKRREGRKRNKSCRAAFTCKCAHKRRSRCSLQGGEEEGGGVRSSVVHFIASPREEQFSIGLGARLSSISQQRKKKGGRSSEWLSQKPVPSVNRGGGKKEKVTELYRERANSIEGAHPLLKGRKGERRRMQISLTQKGEGGGKISTF